MLRSLALLTKFLQACSLPPPNTVNQSLNYPIGHNPLACDRIVALLDGARCSPHPEVARLDIALDPDFRKSHYRARAEGEDSQESNVFDLTRDTDWGLQRVKKCIKLRPNLEAESREIKGFPGE